MHGEGRPHRRRGGARLGERWLPAPDVAREGEERMALLPHVALLDALDAPDLHALDDVPLQGLSQHVVAYTWRGRPARVLLNPYTGLPTAAEIDSAYPDDVFWGVWGDVTTRMLPFWDLLPGGLHYPLQWDVARRGLPDRTLMIAHLALNPTLPGDTFALPEDASGGYADAVAHGPDDPPLGSPARPPVTLGRRGHGHSRALGVTLVRQDDGVVVLEAPISDGYARKVMAEAARRFPGCRSRRWSRHPTRGRTSAAFAGTSPPACPCTCSTSTCRRSAGPPPPPSRDIPTRSSQPRPPILRVVARPHAGRRVPIGWSSTGLAARPASA